MRIAAIGDSVVWGQGLKHPLEMDKLKAEEKYVFKIVEWLQQEGLAKNMDRADFLAHSGAIIGTHDTVGNPPSLKKEESKNPKSYDLYYGEIPDAYPTILGQLKQIKDSHSVDMLILNGGANDVEILKMLTFSHFTPSFQSVLQLVDTYAKDRVSVLLNEARKACPNAIIVYTGYYPGISPDSNIPLSTISLLNDLKLVPSLAYLSYVFPITLVGELLVKSQLPRIKRQGLIFHKRMLGKFREQVSIFNSNRDPETLPVIFCPSGFGSANAMLAKNEYVSSPTKDPNKTVSGERKKICEEMLSGFMCSEAYLAHPNVKGANQYYKELKKRVEQQVRFSLRTHFEGMDSRISSISQLKNKYKFVPAKSLRNLTDVLWLDSVLVEYNIAIFGLEVPVVLDRYGNVIIDTGEENQDTKRYDQMMTRENTITNGSMWVDLGFKQGFESINYTYNQKVSDNHTVDLNGAARLADLKYIEIRLPQYYQLLFFTLELKLKINGYLFKTLNLHKGSFSESKEKNGNSPKYYYHRINEV